MPVNAVSLPGTPIATTSGLSQSQRQTNPTSQARLVASNAPASNDRDSDNDSKNEVQASKRAQEAKPSLNAQGQTVGTTINTTA